MRASGSTGPAAGEQIDLVVALVGRRRERLRRSSSPSRRSAGRRSACRTSACPARSRRRARAISTASPGVTMRFTAKPRFSNIAVSSVGVLDDVGLVGGDVGQRDQLNQLGEDLPLVRRAPFAQPCRTSRRAARRSSKPLSTQRPRVRALNTVMRGVYHVTIRATCPLPSLAPSPSKICAAWRKRRLPRMVFDYIDGGAEREWTLRENCRAFEDVMFRPRSAVATPSCDLKTTRARHCRSICRSSSRPSAAAACSIRAARKKPPRAAGDAGTIYTLSTLSGCTMEDVKAATTGPRVVSAVSRRRPRRRDEGDRARQGCRLQGAGRHDRYAGRRHARARFAQRRQGTPRAQPVDGALSRPDARRARAGSTPSSATAA